jgi:hypothetical protein
MPSLHELLLRLAARNLLGDRASIGGSNTIENVKKNPIHWQKNFKFVGEFEASSEMRSL